MKNTPGPWDFDGCTENGKPSTGENRRYHQIDGSRGTVCDTSNRDYRITPDEDAANARLISLCPTMAEYITRMASEGDKEAQQIAKKF